MEQKKVNVQMLEPQPNNGIRTIDTTSSQTIAKPHVSGRYYQIDFGNHLRCKIKVTDAGIEVEGAMNGWGNGVPLSEVVIVELQ